MKKAKRPIGIVLVALQFCLAADALAVRFGTVITRFWSGTYGTVRSLIVRNRKKGVASQ